jgi:Tol biopolymer transport system component
MRHVLCVAVALAVVAQAGAVTAPPDALMLGARGELWLVDASGATTGSVGGFTPSADWSPDGTRLAYVNDAAGLRGLYVAAGDGSGAREVARQPTSEVWGAVLWVSADEVAFFSRAARSSSSSIRVVPVAGGPERVLTNNASLNAPPSLQPGGSLLAYAVAQTNARALVDVRTGVSTLLPVTRCCDALVWSPDGSLLALSTGPAIEVMRPDGTGSRTVYRSGAIRGELTLQSPVWSPDGSRIAFTRRDLFTRYQDRFGTPARTEIYSVGVDGSGLVRLTGVSGDDLRDGGSFGSFAAAWWPDGSRLFFRRNAAGPFMTMNADGSCETPWRGPSGPVSPRWRPGAAVSVGPVQCSSAVVRLRTTLTEVSHRNALPLTAVVRNDGTRALVDVRVSLTASRGTLVAPQAACGRGKTIVCALGDVEPGRELVLPAQASFRAPGTVTITAKVSTAVADDVDPADDSAVVQALVSPCDLLGTSAADRLVGTRSGEHICGRPGRDVIDARGGHDRIEAGSGADTVIAGTGRDVVDGAGGRDTIRVRDGERDLVSCGSERDTVVADRLDRVDPDCERVLRR